MKRLATAALVGAALLALARTLRPEAPPAMSLGLARLVWSEAPATRGLLGPVAARDPELARAALALDRELPFACDLTLSLPKPAAPDAGGGLVGGADARAGRSPSSPSAFGSGTAPDRGIQAEDARRRVAYLVAPRRVSLGPASGGPGFVLRGEGPGCGPP